MCVTKIVLKSKYAQKNINKTKNGERNGKIKKIHHFWINSPDYSSSLNSLFWLLIIS